MKELTMNMESMSNTAILQEIGRRLKAERLNRNLTQAKLAEQAGVGRRTLQKAEEGEVTTMETVVAILRGLGLLNQLDQFLPEPPVSPVQLARQAGNKRQRASGKRKQKTSGDTWQWGD